MSILNETLKLEFRPYCRRFRAPIKTAHGAWERREGVVLRLESADGRFGFGEAAPIPWFSEETAGEIEGRLKGRESITMPELPLVAAGMPTLGWALECAFAQVVRRGEPPEGALDVAGLLPSGALALERLDSAIATGRRAFKWKIGVQAVDEEIEIASQLVARLPSGAKLRFDANGGLGDCFQRWLDWAIQHEGVIDYLEQPLPVGRELEMEKRAAGLGVPFALDESVAGIDELIDHAAQAPSAVLVVKPSLLGSIWRFLEWRNEHPGRRVVFSSAFETAVGFKAAWELAVSDPGSEAAGFGVVDLLEDDGLCPLSVGASLCETDFPAGVEERVWSAL